MPTLTNALVIQELVTSNTYEILDYRNDIRNKQVGANIKTCDAPYKQEWVIVWEGEEYDALAAGWGQTELEAKITSILEAR